jgi:L-threonylcarbamoyladenylate synthase
MDRMIIFVAKIILITTMNINEEFHKAYEVIKKAESSCIPDTVWELDVMTNSEAVAKIYKLKQRAESQSMIVLMNGERMMYNVFKDILRWLGKSWIYPKTRPLSS